MPDEFTVAAECAVRYLDETVPLRAWVVAVVGSDGSWTPVAAVDHGYGFQVGAQQRWQDTVCSRMAQGLGPPVSPRVEESPAYASAPIRRRYPIGAYVGTSLRDADGEVVATICGLDPAPHPDELARHLPLVRTVADLLGAVRRVEEQRRAADERAHVAEETAGTCALTGLLNRRGWLDRLPQLVSHGDRAGTDLALLSLDVDGLKEVNDREGHAAGDALLVRVAAVLREALRPADLLVRFGGDEFGVAGLVRGRQRAGGMSRRVRQALEQAGLTVSVGAGLRAPGGSVEQAWLDADAAMYADKQARRARGTPRRAPARPSAATGPEPVAARGGLPRDR